MAKEINLLKDQLAAIRKKARKLLLIRSSAFAVLIIYGLIVVAAFSYHLVEKRRSEIFRQKIKQEEALIEKLRPIEAKQTYVSYKVKSLAEILAAKKEHQQIVESVVNLLPTGLSVSNFHIDEDNWVHFSASCLRFEVMVDFLDHLDSEKEGQLKVKEARIGQVSYGLEQEYHFDVNILFYLGEKS